eukprot:4917446-Prymnesium_polylepis.1
MEKRKEFKFELSATLIEVAGNAIIDLWGDDVDGECPKVMLRGGELHGVRLEKVHSSRGLTQLIEVGMSKRKTDQNLTHAHSSRSHAFLTMHLEKKTLQGTRGECPAPGAARGTHARYARAVRAARAARAARPHTHPRCCRLPSCRGWAARQRPHRPRNPGRWQC